MKQQNNRRTFLKKITVGGIGSAIFPFNILSAKESHNAEGGLKIFRKVN